MSTTYRAIQWNRYKRQYDLVLLFLIVVAVAAFYAVSLTVHRGIPINTILLRGSAFLSLFLIHMVLCIGPLARLNKRFLPLLYNRRHLGVCLFFAASFHGIFALFQHHAFGDTFFLASVFTSYSHEYTAAFASPADLARIPFEPFGALALVILYLMAVTSHDFWLRLLGPSVWKALHTLVYAGYTLVVLHVAFGFLQGEVHLFFPVLLLSGSVILIGLHAAALVKGITSIPAPPPEPERDGYFPVCRTGELEPGKGSVVRAGKRKVALFLYKGRVYALGNVCRHQGGPIGEGQIVDGCVTCPWHGRQYRPEDGESPPPFDGHIPAYPVLIHEGIVYVKPEPVPRGTAQAGGTAPELDIGVPSRGEFFIGHEAEPPRPIRDFMQVTAIVILFAGPLFMAGAAALQPAPNAGSYAARASSEIEGVFYSTPVPAVYVQAPAGGEPSPPGYNILLCGTGKSGIPPAWREFDGQQVRLTGRFFHRRELAMLEVSPSSPPAVLGAPPAGAVRPDTEVIGPVSLAGELAATKCYLGAMWPATGKVHRACAIRCLSAGVPPGLVVGSPFDSTAVLLAGPGEEPLEYDVRWAGRQVRAAGILERRNGFSLIRVESLSLYEPEPEEEVGEEEKEEEEEEHPEFEPFGGI